MTVKMGERVVGTTVESKDRAGKVVKTVAQVDLGAAVTAAKKE